MSKDLGLPALFITGERETWEKLSFEAEPRKVVCPHCGSSDGLADPELKGRTPINDTPSRGKPTTFDYLLCRYHCSPCHKYFDGPTDGIDLKRGMTHRLIRYIENSAPRRPRLAIAAEVGVSTDRVRNLVNQLADRLARHHRFPTPRVLGLDDIKMNRKWYIILTDAELGHAVGLIEGADADLIGKWIDDNLTIERVELVVSDLGKALIKAAKEKLPDALHVADRWHILQGCQKAMSRVINQELAPLDLAAAAEKAKGVKKQNNQPRKKARTLRSLRRDLLGRQRLKIPDGEESLFDEALLKPVLDSNERLSRAFYARIDLARVHQCAHLADAQAQLQRFYVSASHPTIAGEFSQIVSRLKRHEELLWNFFRARAKHPDVPAVALTTSSTERRNGTLRTSWKAGRGVTRFNYLRLLALYEPWKFDIDIVECGVAGCGAIEGPVPLVPGLVGQARDEPVMPRGHWRCTAHA